MTEYEKSIQYWYKEAKKYIKGFDDKRTHPDLVSKILKLLVYEDKHKKQKS